jgi:hypothetical protein
MLQDSIKLTGRLSIKKFNDKDELIFQKEVPNLVVQVGKNWIASRLVGTLDKLTNAGSLVTGGRYRILALGTTDWDSASGNSPTTSVTPTAINGSGVITIPATTFATNQAVQIIGTNSGAGSITGYVTGTVYYIQTGGTNLTTYTLLSSPGGSAVSSSSGSLTNLTLKSYTYAVGNRFVAQNAGSGTGQCLFSDAMGYMAIGDNYAGVQVTQSALTNEIARVASSSLSSSGANASFSATFPAGTGTSSSIQEAGIFNRSSTNLYSFNSATNVYNTQTLVGVGIPNSTYQFSCSAQSWGLVVGQTVTISGTNTGTGTINGTANGTGVYYITSTNGTTGFNLSAVSPTGSNIAVVGGTPVGLTYTLAQPNTITLTGHGLSSGDVITYSSAGGTVVGGLTDGAQYYVIYIDADHIQLASTYTLATTASTSWALNNLSLYPIVITRGTGTQKIIYGVMLARTTFAAVNKLSSESLAISWTVTVG